jgi:hypothetical protein
VNNQPIFRTEIDRLKMRGFIDAERLNFVGVFPYNLSAGAEPSVTLQNRRIKA